MARFQAKTNAATETSLESLQKQLNMRENQKADLLREVTALAQWVVSQAALGRTLLAQGEDGAQEELRHPLLERLRELHAQSQIQPQRIDLSESEAQAIHELLSQPFRATPGLLASLKRLSDPDRKAPVIQWTEEQ